MGRTKTTTTYIIAILVFTFCVYRLVIFNSNDPLFQIMKLEVNKDANTKVSLVFGYIPKSIKQAFFKEKIKSKHYISYNYRLVFYNNLMIEDASEGYIFFEDIPNVAYTLLVTPTPPITLPEYIKKNIEYENHKAFLVNKQSFNYITEKFNIKEKEKIIDFYMFLLSNINDNCSSQRLFSIHNIKELNIKDEINSIDIDTNLYEYDFLNKRYYSFSTTNEIWEFEFYFDSDTNILIEVKSKLIWHLDWINR